jgi:hypothetical protein
MDVRIWLTREISLYASSVMALCWDQQKRCRLEGPLPAVYTIKSWDSNAVPGKETEGIGFANGVGHEHRSWRPSDHHQHTIPIFRTTTGNSRSGILFSRGPATPTSPVSAGRRCYIEESEETTSCFESPASTESTTALSWAAPDMRSNNTRTATTPGPAPYLEANVRGSH